MRGKPIRAQKWLPTQVAYGIDCSALEPDRWVPFGDEHEKAVASAATAAQKSAVKASPPGQ